MVVLWMDAIHCGNYSCSIHTRSNVQSVADEIKKYKELLDENVITEEEFKEKKEQLLKLM